MRYRTAAMAIALTTHFFTSAAWADWMVVNNLEESFTISVWPQNQRYKVSRKIIEAGRQGTLKLGKDNHIVQLVSGGGDVYTLRPTTLQNRGTTNLKTILTPDGRRNGRINYAYMNQRGFDENDDADMIRELGRSTWDTSYIAPDGQQIDARVEFRGEQGRYKTNSFAGELVNLQFTTGKIYGEWKTGNQRGQFEFQIDNNQEQLTGRWTQDGNQWRPWTGTRRR